MLHLLYGAAFLTGGAILLVVALRLARTARASPRWPTVIGTVKRSGTRSTGRAARAADVSVAFEVAGQSYTCARISLGSYATGGGGHAQREADRYPVGAQVAVYYDPRDPNNALLEPGGGWFLIGFLAFFAMVFLFVGVVWGVGGK